MSYFREISPRVSNRSFCENLEKQTEVLLFKSAEHSSKQAYLLALALTNIFKKTWIKQMD